MGVGEFVMSESYYEILNVRRDCSEADLRRAYRKLAMQWHPDKWAKTPALLGEAKLKFQKIQEAYSVLSDPGKRILYDAGMYDGTDEYDEGFCDFMQEMWSLMSDVKEEKVCKNWARYLLGQRRCTCATAVACSMDDLQGMMAELIQGFDMPGWYSTPPVNSNWGGYGNFQQEAQPSEQATHRQPASTFGMFGMSNCCR